MTPNDIEVISKGLIAIGIILLLLFVAREVTLWYFRINERTKLLKDILTELKKQNKEEE